MRLRTKLLLGSALLVVTNLLSGIVLIWTSQTLVELNLEQTRAQRRLEGSLGLASAVEACKSAAFAYAAGLASTSTEFEGRCRSTEAALARVALMAEAVNPGLGHRVALARDELLAIRIRPSEQRTAELGRVLGSTAYRELQSEVAEMSRRDAAEGARAEERARTILTRLEVVGWVTPLLSGVFVIALLLWVLPRLLRGLRVLRRATVAVARGRLDRPLMLSGRDELAELAHSFNIMKRELTDARERQQNAELLARDLSRQAGKAEIAAGVLHNVGNALNGATVAASLIKATLDATRAGRFVEALAQLVECDQTHGGAFARDQRGKKLLAYLEVLARRWGNEINDVREHFHELERSIRHIRLVIAKQQEHAKSSGVFEECKVDDLISEAIELAGTSFERHGITLRQFHAVSFPVMVDRHRALQIVVNLLVNAKDAIVTAGRSDGCIQIESSVHDEESLHISVRDNGSGIDEHDIPKLFQHGFTTKPDGHGFGLHNCALSAKQAGGDLRYEGAGLGCGASFSLLLPVRSIRSTELTFEPTNA